MATIKSYRIRNLRSFGDNNEYIPIKNMNIYVGKNSCGKSTALRTFPLLRQSVESETKAPILWYGRYVDFGDLTTAIHDGREELMFDFNISTNVQREIFRSIRSLTAERFFFLDDQAKNSKFDIELTVALKLINTKINATITIKVLQSEFRITYSDTSISSFSSSHQGSDEAIHIPFNKILDKGNILPIRLAIIEQSQKHNEPRRAYKLKTTAELYSEHLVKALKTLHHASKAEEKIRNSISDLPLFDNPEKLIEKLRKLFQRDKKFIERLNTNQDEISNTLTHLMLGMHLDEILTATDQAIGGFYKGVRYLGPVRASAERYYRHQDLQVDEIDHTGSNLPMVINSLESHRKKELSAWVKTHFGFNIQIENNGLHYAILIKEDGDQRYHNVSDMGFGYSQILPVIVSIWLESGKAKPRRRQWHDAPQKIIAIEQPELHLHPELQFKFGLALSQIVRLSKENNLAPISFVIETHSKHLIDAIGDAIRCGNIEKSDVNITLYEKSDEGITNTSLASFDEDGYLTNWPAGFLAP